ncbi:class I fructose-bisphosphate aldolase, partial [Mycobacterium tuberculosis]
HWSSGELEMGQCEDHGVIASFSRALTEGLSTAQSPAQFNAVLDEAINAIATASRT